MTWEMKILQAMTASSPNRASGNASASTSATGLIEALNAQLTAVGGQFNANMGTAAGNAGNVGNFNHGGGRLADNLLVATAAGVSQLGNLGSMPNLSNLGSMPNLSNLGSLPSLSNLTSIANTTNMTNSAGWNSANHPITTNQNNTDTQSLQVTCDMVKREYHRAYHCILASYNYRIMEVDCW